MKNTVTFINDGVFLHLTIVIVNNHSMVFYQNDKTKFSKGVNKNEI